MARSLLPGSKGIHHRSILVVCATTLAMIGFYGTTISFSVFIKPLIGEFGWTRAAISGGMSTLIGTAGLVGIVMGPFVDKYGVRIFIAIGALLGGSGYLLMYNVHSLWQLYLYFGVMMGICQASCWVSVTATISRIFVEKRVLMLGVSTCGITIGQMIIPPVASYFITAYGWRPAYVMLAIIVWLSAIPALMLLGQSRTQQPEIRDSNQKHMRRDTVGETKPTREWSILEAIQTVQFWMLVITGFVIAAGYYFVITHMIAYAPDVGIPATSAALVITSVGGGSVLGKLIVWLISKRMGSRLTLIVLLFLQASALFFLMHTVTLWIFLVLGAIFGFGFGATSPIRTSMIPEFFGLRAVGTIIGLSNAAYSIGGLAGPVVAGHIFDVSRNYDAAFIAGGSLLIIGMAAAYFLKTPAQKTA